MINQSLKAQLDMAFISSFSVNSTSSINRLDWTVGNNQGAKSFWIERCTNGKDFKTIAVLLATEKLSTESYRYADTITSQDKIMYRLRILSKNQHTFYSKIVITQSKITPNYNIKILGNPVTDQLSFNYYSKGVEQADIKIYNLCGKIVLDQKINSFRGNNLITIQVNSAFTPGMYIMKMNNGISTQTVKFVKQ